MQGLARGLAGIELIQTVPPNSALQQSGLRPAAERWYVGRTKMTAPLWITYAWADNADGDFDYLVGVLEATGITTLYDRIALVPGQRLWDQIGARITSTSLSGWAFLVTPNSLASAACREELSYALQRTLSTKGAEFPLVGLLSGVKFAELPPALAVRLCVDLRSPDWLEQVRAAVEQRPPSRVVAGGPNFQRRAHNTFLGQANLRALEFHPRFGELRYWRIAFPAAGPSPVRRGIGPSGGGGLVGVLSAFVEGMVDLDGVAMKFFGAGDALSPGTSAYVVFDNVFPKRVAFGWAHHADGLPAEWWPLEVS